MGALLSQLLRRVNRTSEAASDPGKSENEGL